MLSQYRIVACYTKPTFTYQVMGLPVASTKTSKVSKL